jgi:DNA-binding XRE family transcriptional regulator
MLACTKKHPTESIRFYGTPQTIDRLRKYARSAGAIEAPADSVPAEEVSPDLLTNPHGVYLKGLRYREDLTQVQLAEITGIPRRHISEMESGKRTIGKAAARKLAEALKADYRLFL